jgi:phosphate uptake regulator
MPDTASKVQEALVKAALQMAERPDLTDAEVDHLYRLVLRLIAELSVRRPNEDIAA